MVEAFLKHLLFAQQPQCPAQCWTHNRPSEMCCSRDKASQADMPLGQPGKPRPCFQTSPGPLLSCLRLLPSGHWREDDIRSACGQVSDDQNCPPVETCLTSREQAAFTEVGSRPSTARGFMAQDRRAKRCTLRTSCTYRVLTVHPRGRGHAFARSLSFTESSSGLVLGTITWRDTLDLVPSLVGKPHTKAGEVDRWVSPRGGSWFRREVGTVCGNECHVLGLTGSLLGRTRWPGVESSGWETGWGSQHKCTQKTWGIVWRSWKKCCHQWLFKRSLIVSDRRLSPRAWHPG